MASNNKKVVLPTSEQFETVLSLIGDHILEEDVDLDSDDCGYTKVGYYVSLKDSDAYKAVYNYLESLHPPVYKTKSVKEKVGRQGLK